MVCLTIDPLHSGGFACFFHYFKACTKENYNISKDMNIKAQKRLQDGGNTLVAKVKFEIVHSRNVLMVF